jgi:hypothetical protein
MPNLLKKTLLIATLVPAASIAATPGKTPAPAAPAQTPEPAATPGPKVHVSDAKDTTGCDKLFNPAAAAAGRVAGAVVGAKLGVGMMGHYGMVIAGDQAAIQASNASRCNAKAEVGQDAAQPAQKPKKKLRLPSLGF